MTTREFLASLRRKNVRLRAEGETLRFHAPEGALTAEDKDTLRQRKAEILAHLRGAERDDAAIVRVPRGGALPLSFAQQRLWFVDQLGAGAAYNMPWAVWLDGELDVAALERSIHAIVERHEVLRTRLPAVDGKAVQEILPELEVPLAVEDFRGFDEAKAQCEVERCYEEERNTPFDLSRGPLVRPNLLRVGERLHLLNLTFHHIVVDGWSFGLFNRELVAHYRAFTTGAPVELPDLPVQYADFACWQRQTMQGETLEREIAYWRDRLDRLPALDLPTDRPRPAMQTFHGAFWPFKIPAELSDSLRALSREQDVTLSMTLLAVYKVLLARYSGQDDVVVGAPIANRNRYEIENLIGFFVNTLVLRTNLAGDPTFLEAVRRVRETSLGAYEHQDVPFEKLVEELDPVRDPSRSPLFQVVFSMQNIPRSSLALEGLAVRPYGAKATNVRFDLECHVFELEDEIACRFVYNADLFDGATIERMAMHFRALLEGIAADPTTRISELPLLGEQERIHLLSDGADESRSYPADVRVHERFEARAESSPDAAALTFEDRSLTYGELNARANRMAHYLRGRGIGPEVLVGVCIERSLDLVIAILGVLKAGGAYVPLDPGYPKQRLSFILDDSHTRLLLTQSHLTGELPGDVGEVMCLDASAADIDRQPQTNPVPLGTPSDPAYVIYTSGSTGEPKGVVVQHDNLARLFHATEEWYGFDDSDVWTLFHSSAFDFSVWEIWGALLYGGRLVVVPHEISRSPEEFHALVCREGVTVLNQTPSAFRQFIHADAAVEGREALALRFVIFGGEALELESLRPWFERHGDERPQLVNMYGITETTVHVTYRPLRMADLSEAPGSVIGRPIPDLRVLVLEAHGQPCPVGVPGELYVGGAGVARGYLSRPALTAERFVSDPYSDEPGRRLYRTGDVARLLANGDLEYLGRNDEQVKVRGFRIELGEIEAALLRDERVREAVAMVREDDPGTKRIVAYVVADGDDVSMVSELRASVAEQLPQYMVPASFVPIESVPLTAHGKVDRRALPTPTGERWSSEDAFVAPRTELESTLAGIWSDMLRVERVGVHDNFFELGGDSILSIQIIARTRQAGLHLTPRQMFQHQTVAELAAVAGITERSSVHAEQGAVVGEAPLTPIQHWFFEQQRLDPHHYNQARLFSVRERLDPVLLERTVDALVTHHDALRSRFERGGSGWRQRIVDPGGEPPFEQVDLTSLDEHEQRDAIHARAAELQASLVLDEGPLMRVAWFDLGPERPGRVLIVIHHLVVDGVSWRILQEDLQRGLEQLARGESVQLPPKTTSFQRWANRLVSHAQSDEMRAELGTWLDQRWDDAGELPTEGPASENVGGNARYVSAQLSKEETRALLREVPRAYNTQIDDVLLTALAQTLAPWTGRCRLLVDMEGHGREDLFDDVDLSRTVGWFTSIHPVLVDIGDSDGQPLPAGTALKAVKEQLRSVPNRGIGYGLLRYLDGDDRLPELPKPQLSFNYLGQFDQPADAQSMFELASESMGELHSPRDLRSHVLGVTGAILGGRLSIGFLYGSGVLDAEKIETLVERYREALVALVEHCTAPGIWGRTPSDFPLADVDQKALDRVVAQHGPDGIEDLYALSPMQLGMLFHSAHEPTTGVYVEQLRFDADQLDPEAFVRAWERVIDRHAVLRTSIVGAATETPAQLVHRSAPLRITRHDCRDLDETACDAWVDAFLREDRRRGFDLSEPGLMRLAIVHRGGERHQIIWTFHHIILDGWSFLRVLNEVFESYAALRGGRETNLPAVPPFREYVGWLRRQDETEAREYWKRTLAGFETPTMVTPSSSRVGPRERVSRYAAEWASVAPDVKEALDTLARDHQLTLNTLVVGAWALLLSRYSGEDDVVFGTIVSGRPPDLPGVESAIGMFVNVLPLRVRVRPDYTIGQWLSRLQDQQAELRQYEYSPLWEAQRASEVPHGSPLFQCIFAFENYPTIASTGESGRPEIRFLRMIERTGYPLTFSTNPRLSLRLIYDSGQFDASAIRGILGHFKNLLESIAAGGERPVSRIAMLSPEERQRLLVEWNNTTTTYPREAGIPELFEEQVALRPDAPAVQFEEQALTYSELNRRANQLAHYLQRHGVGRGSLVAVFMERGVDFIVGLIGILKAGAAYVPLDTDYPEQRLAVMLEDAEAPVLLTQERLLGALPEHGGETICIDRDWQAIGSESEDRPTRAGSALDLAYVIYTSGSTGVPKGVCVPHRAINRLVLNTEYVQVEPSDRVAQASNASFDAATFEIWGGLLNGAQVVGISKEVTLSARRFAEVLREQGITTMFLTTALFNQLSLEVPDIFGTLHHLMFGGELVDPGRVRAVLEHGAPRRLLHVYGPTECTTFSTWHAVHEVAEDAATVPIGRPISNSTMYVLDRALNPVPVGVPGELYLGGDGLADGYYERPELTAKRFVPDPFGGPDARLYRTGDVVRYRPDGAIEFLGRDDDQVKLRGFRIELGEIETALLRHKAIEEAVVLCRQDEPGNKYLAAYIVIESAQNEETVRGGLREFLETTLPPYMVPSAFVFLESLPLNPNGKVDRRALPVPTVERQAAGAYVAPRSELEQRIAAIWCEVLDIGQVGVRDNFFDVGGHSLRLLRVHARLAEELDLDVSITDLFEYPTIESLVARFGGTAESETPLYAGAEARVSRRRGEGDSAVAVIGMAGRFPGAPDVETLWSNLLAGVESIRFFSEDELRDAGIPETMLQQPSYVKAGTVLENEEYFDANLFGYTPREAELIDPQQRVFLECAWEAVERAGYDPERYAGMIGVYAGIGTNSYRANLLSRPDIIAGAGGMQVTISGGKDFVATRVSYKLNLRGPSLTVQAACSTSLIAVHEACRSLLDHQCDTALAGGVSIHVPLINGYMHVEGGIFSPDGHCRPFDARARGTITGKGAGVVVLKRLDDALRDGDEIHAVLRGTAINNDGSQKIGYTAPSVQGQSEVIALAHACAGVGPEDITYVEAHGTATALGDPIEVAALTKVFRERTAKRGFCALGSLKSNMGHLGEAAGVAGLIKTILAVKYGELPPSLHYESPNPEIDFENSPFYVVTQARPWETPDGVPRRAGVSSFGLGGTNAHAVVEEAPSREPTGPSREWQLLVLSAKTRNALDEATVRLADHLQDHRDVNLADVAFTLQVGRRQFAHRRAVLCRDVAQAVDGLNGGAPGRVWTSQAPELKQSVVFMFPGHGHQHVNMGRGLYETEAVFRDTVDEGLGYLQDEFDFDLRSFLFPAEIGPAASAALLGRPTIFQPAVFLIDYAMAQLWQSWGIEPAACIGHSLGEYVAACVSGVLTYEDALRIVALRGRLMEQTPAGAMLSLPLSESRVRELLEDEEGVWLSTINAPSLCLVSGEPGRVESLEDRLTRDGVECNRVAATHAYHSGMMESGVGPLVDAVRKAAVHPPRIPFVSNLTGDWIDAAEARDPEYWGQHLREPVRFAEGMERVLGMSDHALVEVGPGQIISSLARMHPGCGPDRLVVPSMRHPKADDVGDAEFLTGALARLWSGGVQVEWERVHEGERRRRVILPTYPFQREKYFIEPGSHALAGARPRSAKRRPDLADWFYVPSWDRSMLPAPQPLSGDAEHAPNHSLVFTNGSPLAARVVEGLELAGRAVVRVAAGDSFGGSNGNYTVRPGARDDYWKLFTALSDSDRTPTQIVHLWGATTEPARSDDAVASCQVLGFYSLMALAQGLEDAGIGDPVRVDVVTAGVHEVTGEERLHPAKATVLGPARVIPVELPHIDCRLVDLSVDEVHDDDSRSAGEVLRELLSGSSDRMVAYRRGRRMVESFAATRLDALDGEHPDRLRPNGTYLIPGGLGGIGNALARYLAGAVGANLVVTGRTALPDRSLWSKHLDSHEDHDALSLKIRAVQQLEAAGARVMYRSADLVDLERMREVTAEAVERFGAIHGVIQAAGLPSEGLILLKDREQAGRVLAAKVDGSRVLEQLFRDVPLDFMVLCSSLASVVGVPGLSDYGASNAYLDAFARDYASRTGTFTVSVDWNRWREAGMAVERARQVGFQGEITGNSDAEGVELFRRILARSTEPQVLVSEADLDAAFRVLSREASRPTDGEEDGTTPRESSQPTTTAAAEGHARPMLANEYVAPRSETERTLAGIWGQLLGIRDIGVHDNFFDLGGHSLLATQVMSRIRDTLRVEVPLRSLFHAPTIAALAETVAPSEGAEPVATLIPRVPRQGDLPLSFAQQRLWVLDRMEPGQSVYNVCQARRLKGDLDVPALGRAVREIVRRHETLRTTFEIRDGNPAQIVHETVSSDLHQLDLSSIEEERREEEARRLTSELAGRPFDLEKGPLFRASLIRLEDRDFILVLTMHHIISDGWSMGVLLRELRGLYEAFSNGKPSPYPDLPIQYADYAQWQRDWLQGDELEAQATYWRNQLAGAPAVLELPTDRPRPPVLTFNGTYKGFQLSDEVSATLNALGAQSDATPFMSLLALFVVLLHRLSGQNDISVGSPIAGRNRSELEGLIGFFVNTLVLRVDLAGDPTFHEILRRVREVALESFSHQDLPFERLVEELQPDRHLNISPLFQVMFVLHNAPMDPLELPGLSVEPAPLGSGLAKYDLTMTLSQWEDRWYGGLEYNTDLFDASTIDRMIRAFQTLADAVVADPDRPVAELALLPSTDRRRLLVEWNDTQREFPADRSLHQLVEDQVRRTPDASAVVYRDRALTYRELNARANQLAHALGSRGVGPETLVGICIERSAEMVIAVLGVLKAGAAYVPLDPDYPRQRLELIVDDTRAPVVLTTDDLATVLPEHGARIVRIDPGTSVLENQPATNPDRDTSPDNLAYVIYTSGSTGTPKGVLLTHRGAVALVHWALEVFGADDLRGVLAATSICFDLSVFELFVTLSAGGTVILTDHVLSLPELAARDKVTLVNTVPSAIAGLVRQDAIPESVRTVNLAGEPLLPGLVDEIYEAGVERVYDLYGPSEDTTYSTFALRERGGPATIGRPVANERTYILDAALGPVPIGVQGELYIGGTGLARGYLGRPDLTAERFVPDPFGKDPGGRLYRTGDLARYRPDGTIEFLGRRDHQVKLRGYRIELEEVEANLARSSLVEDVAVVCREDERGDKELVAYVVGEGGHEPSPSELRSHLGETLPEYMVPSAFVVLESMPLTPHGKIDRRALPAPSGDRQVDELYVSPRGDLENRIAAIWREILRVDQVGVRDNFFDLGGHSLRLIQVHARIVEELGFDLTVTDLFRYPTVESLVERLRGAGDDRSLQTEALSRVRSRGSEGDSDIAVIAMAGRFPGAPDVETLWANLRDGVESTRFFNDDELREAGVSEALLDHPDYVKARPVLDGADLFDARLFGYTPREAETIDPQQRIFLECAWESLERAGYDPERYAGLIGVYAGMSMNTYSTNLRSNPEIIASMGGFQIFINNDKDFLPTRVSYKLNLRGPSVNVQTACSTSLVAVHEACRSLLERRCDLALAGGVSVTFPMVSGYPYQEGGIFSPDGHCRPFDARARGTISGNGVGIVVLKRLREAMRDGDQIHAVIRGTATNNDGSLKVGYTAPSVEGQAEVIAMAQAEAGVDPKSVTYVEAHGTATALGDPVEVAALTRVFGERSTEKAFCGLGSLKSNMGHLDAAAGVAGLIKTVLALEHGKLPPSLHFEQPNPEIDFANGPFYVVRELRDWKTANGEPRRAGVSSFGIGGTNAHAVLEEAPAIEPSSPSRERQVLVLSAKDPAALDAATTNLAAWLREHDDVNLADVAYTLQIGRQEFEYRRAVACRSVVDAVEGLEGGAAGRSWTSQASQRKPSVVFMFPGHGHQHINMGRGLYESEAVFRDTVDEGLGYLRDDLEFDLESYLFPADVGSDASAALRGRPTIFQPAVFLIDYAMAKLWQSWGIEPAACIGHSLGEYVAACVSGVLTYEDALRIVTLRGRLMERTPHGSMLSIELPEDRVRELLANEQQIWLSAVNAPSLSLVSGDPDHVASFEERLAGEGVECNRIAATHAYHSGMMDSGVEPLVEAVRKSTPGRGGIPFVSNLTGDWIKESEARDPEYWGRHLREPVRFAEGMERIFGMADHVLLEVGPGQIISSLARMHPGCGPDRLVVPSMRHPQADDLEDADFLMGALARLWTAGVDVDWPRFHAGSRRCRLTLPTYAFQRERYWVERRLPESRRTRASLDDWFYVPAWRRVAVPDGAASRAAEQDGACCLVFAEDSEFSRRIVEGLETAGRRVTVVEAGDAYGRNGERHVIVPGSREDYVRLMTALVEEKRVPRQIVHLWGVGPDLDRLDDAVAERCLDRGFFSLLHLAQALEDASITGPVGFDVLTSGVDEIEGDETLHPERAAVLGPCRVVGAEFPTISCRHVDLADEEVRRGDPRVHEQVLTELLSDSDVSRVAYRQGRRWVESFTRVRLQAPEKERPRRLRTGGTYLITGGLGGIGLELAKYLARSVKANLVLTARTPLPDRAAWSDHVAEHGEDDPLSRKIRVVEMLESEGARVLVRQADVTALDRMREVVSEATERFGGIHGVVHSAGVLDDGVILLKEREVAQQVLAPKITGARVLERLFGDAGLDFLILCSSLSGIKGGPGQVDYCAANAYLDVFARHYGARTGTYTVAIDWNRWREVGMAVDAAKDLPGYTGALGGASNREGVEVFRRVLNDSVAPQVVVSHNDLWIELASKSFEPPSRPETGTGSTAEESTEDTRATYSRPRLATEFAAPRTDTESAVAEIWKGLFGIDRVGLHDDFYELGGHSLLATRLLNRVRSAFDVSVSLADVVKSPTVGELALIIETRLFEEIEQLSEEEAVRLVELEPGDR